MYIKAYEQDALPAGSDKPIVIYEDGEGNKLFKSLGSKSWRCNNPGNIFFDKWAWSRTYLKLSHVPLYLFSL